jgi:hypothetical protein
MAHTDELPADAERIRRNRFGESNERSKDGAGIWRCACHGTLITGRFGPGKAQPIQRIEPEASAQSREKMGSKV